MNDVHSLEQLQSKLQSEKLALLYISRENCAVCHALLPQVEELLKQYPVISMMKVSADDLPEVAGAFSIFTVPVIMVFSEGKELFRKARFVPIGELDEQLSKLVSLIEDEGES